MPTKEEAEEAAERIASRLQQRNSNAGNPQQSSVPKLILELSVEALKIHRLHLEERAREAKVDMAAKNKTVLSRRRAAEEHSLRPEGERGHSPRQHQESPTQDRQLHDSHRTDRSAEQASDTSPPMNRPIDQVESAPRERRKRKGRRSSPVGDPPTYKFKPGLTLGFGTHLRECIEYEERRIGKEQRRKERRARRDERGRRLMERGEGLENQPASERSTENHDTQGLGSRPMIEASKNPPGSVRGTEEHGSRHSASLHHGTDIPAASGGEYRPAQLYYSQRDSPQQTGNSVQRSASGNSREEIVRTPSNTPRGTSSVQNERSVASGGQESPRYGSYASFSLADTIRTVSTASERSDRTAREGDATPRQSRRSRPSDISPMSSAVAYERNSHADRVEQMEKEQANSASKATRREHSQRASTHKGSRSGTTSRQPHGKHTQPPSQSSSRSKGPPRSKASAIGYEPNPQGDRVERMEREQAESAQKPPTQRKGQSGEASGRGVGRDGPSWSFDNIS